MDIINKKENQIEVKLNANKTIANAIRRYANQIQILAIDKVEIEKNDSALYDETIAHRIGLIPLKTEKAMNSKTNIQLKINSKKEGNVYSEELKGDAKVVYEKIPITSLNKGQELKITGTARLGKGEEHSKFLPGLIFYRDIIKIKIDNDCPKEVVGICPKNILNIDGDKVKATETDKCDMCEACTDLCKNQGKDSIKLTPSGELLLSIESFGQINAEEIFKQSCEILKHDLAEIEKKINK